MIKILTILLRKENLENMDYFVVFITLLCLYFFFTLIVGNKSFDASLQANYQYLFLFCVQLELYYSSNANFDVFRKELMEKQFLWPLATLSTGFLSV